MEVAREALHVTHLWIRTCCCVVVSISIVFECIRVYASTVHNKNSQTIMKQDSADGEREAGGARDGVRATPRPDFRAVTVFDKNL